MVKTVQVPIIDDTMAESTESFTLQLSSPSGATLGKAVSVATIVDNDGPPPPIMAPPAARLQLGVATPVNGLSISAGGGINGAALVVTVTATDPGSNAATTDIYTVTVSDLQGLLSASGSGITGSGTTNLTITGSLAQVNADLATLRDLDMAAGSDTITVIATVNGGAGATARIPVTVGVPPVSVDGSGRSGVLWHNTSGEAVIWEMNVTGTAVAGGGSLGNPGPSWHERGTGDFNGDGRSDILWQNSSGEVAIWEMNGTNVIGSASLGNPGTS
jgi:hypothetical protein